MNQSNRPRLLAGRWLALAMATLVWLLSATPTSANELTPVGPTASPGYAEVNPGVDATPTTTERAGTSLSRVEHEIIRLTNELRADPDGPLRRRGPIPSCVADSYFAITVDPETGHPVSVPTLIVDERVSAAMARPWALDMQQSASFGHRPSPAQLRIYAQLGVEPTAWGENIAWFSGYPDELTARIHFEGWRESDTGHYCSMLTERFTRIGVGELRVADESWAVQNFYRPESPRPAAARSIRRRW